MRHDSDDVAALHGEREVEQRAVVGLVVDLLPVHQDKPLPRVHALVLPLHHGPSVPAVPERGAAEPVGKGSNVIGGSNSSPMPIVPFGCLVDKREVLRQNPLGRILLV